MVGLFLRLWAVPNAQRESPSGSAVASVGKHSCRRAASPVAGARETLVSARWTHHSSRARLTPKFAREGNPTASRRGAGNTRVGALAPLQLLSAHSLWLPYPD